MTKPTARTGLEDMLLGVARIVFGLMFMQHGAQKLFGMFGADGTAQLMSQMGLAGVLEFFGGLLIVIGLITRPVAFVLSGQMAVAYFIAHFSRGWVPIENGGELSVLYCFFFLYLAAAGGGAWSVDRVLKTRRDAGGI